MSSKQNKSTKYGTLGSQRKKPGSHQVAFYRQASGREPVREWLRRLDPVDRKRIGEDLYTLQLGWPTGMPLARKLEPGLWELRSRISAGIVRIIFTQQKEALVLLHGFTKKSKKLPASDLALAKKRVAKLGERKKS